MYLNLLVLSDKSKFLDDSSLNQKTDTNAHFPIPHNQTSSPKKDFNKINMTNPITKGKERGKNREKKEKTF